MRVKSHGRGNASPMHLALAPTGGRRPCGFRVAGRRLRIVYYRHVCFLQDVTRDLDTTCVRATSGRSRGRASPHVATMPDRMRAHVCAWHCARNVERAARTSKFATSDSEYRSLLVCRFRLGRLRAGCEWLRPESMGRGGGLFGLLSDYRDIPMS